MQKKPHEARVNRVQVLILKLTKLRSDTDPLHCSNRRLQQALWAAANIIMHAGKPNAR